MTIFVHLFIRIVIRKDTLLTLDTVFSVLCLEDANDHFDNPYSISSLSRTLIYEWYVNWSCGSRNRYQNSSVLKRLDYVFNLL